VVSAEVGVQLAGLGGDAALNLSDVIGEPFNLDDANWLSAKGEAFSMTIRGQSLARRVVLHRAGDGFLVLESLDSLQAEAEEARKAAERAETANRTNSAFLAAVSHELREPLVGVVGGIETLKSSGLTAAQSELVALVEQSGHALTRVVDDVVDFASLQAGALVLKAEPFDLRGALLTSAQAFENVTRAAGVELGVSLSDRVAGLALGDEERWRQVATSLIANAVRFTDRGEVTVRADVEGEGADQRLLFEVIDTGRDPGLDPELEPFASGLTAAEASGRTFGVAGLGLAVARALVERMGGSLEIDLKADRGVFRARAPLKAVEADAHPAAATPLSAPAEAMVDHGPVRALVAEDHAVNRRIIELMLAPLGVEVTLAANGAEALEAFRTGGFSLVLLDMQMPVLDGVSAAKAMRETERELGWPRTPIAMLTANVMPRHKTEAMEAGADLFIAKPVTPATLAASLDQLVR
jgi:signal transduction histidine kinase/ActR/RegA family two-component response regulator